MPKLLIKYLSILIFISAIFSSDYKNLILIEFDNVSQNTVYDYFKSSIPNKIKNHPYFNSNFNVEYAKSIEPYLNNETNGTSESLLLMGKFFASNSQIKISYNVYDMNNWDKIITKEFFCFVTDEECITTSLLSSLDKSFSKLFLKSEIDLDLSYDLNSEPLDDENEFYLFDKNYNSSSNFAAEADLQSYWISLNKDDEQNKSNLDTLNQELLFVNEKLENTQKLLAFIDNILKSPYDVSIGEIDFNDQILEEGNVLITVPVQYTIKKSFIEDYIAMLPHASKSNKNGSVSIKFSRDDYIFTSEIDDRFGLMDYQVSPVLYISNHDGKLSKIHIDSWKHKNKLKGENSDFISISDSFYPLFSITPGEKSMHVHLDMQLLKIDYSFNISYEDMANISKVAIKFLYESDVNQTINNTMVNNEE